jgi:hypothetical protein
MQRRQDTNGRGRWLGLLGVSMLAFVAGCDWFGGSTPVGTPPRPGADRQIQPSAALPAPSANRSYEPGTVAVDETRGGGGIGSIVSGKGGQKAQKEAIEKDQMERDKKDREARLEREADDKERKAREREAEKGTGGAAPPSAAPAGVAPPSAAPALEAAPSNAPLPAPVSTTPIPAPSQPATDAVPQAPAAPAPATPAAPVPEKQSALPADTLVVADRHVEVFASI